jgi:hypothetical protein
MKRAALLGNSMVGLEVADTVVRRSSGSAGSAKGPNPPEVRVRAPDGSKVWVVRTVKTSWWSGLGLRTLVSAGHLVVASSHLRCIYDIRFESSLLPCPIRA